MIRPGRWHWRYETELVWMDICPPCHVTLPSCSSQMTVSRHVRVYLIWSDVWYLCCSTISLLHSRLIIHCACSVKISDVVFDQKYAQVETSLCPVSAWIPLCLSRRCMLLALSLACTMCTVRLHLCGVWPTVRPSKVHPCCSSTKQQRSDFTYINILMDINALFYYSIHCHYTSFCSYCSVICLVLHYSQVV